MEAYRWWLHHSLASVAGPSSVPSSLSELDNLDPSSPYSASKVGGELLARSYVRTYGMNVVVTRSSNNYGPFQCPEKLIPGLIIKALNDQPLPIYGKGLNARDWLHVNDNCRAIDIVLKIKNGRIDVMVDDVVVATHEIVAGTHWCIKLKGFDIGPSVAVCSSPVGMLAGHSYVITAMQVDSVGNRSLKRVTKYLLILGSNRCPIPGRLLARHAQRRGRQCAQC